MVSEYEKQKALNIQRNERMLQELGLDKPMIEPKEVRRKKAESGSRRKKRKFHEDTHEHENDEKNSLPPAKRIEVADESGAGPRRSARNSGKTVDYTSEQQRPDPLPFTYSSGVKTTENTGQMGREAGSIRRHNPKQFGSIPGIQVGTWWNTREGCSSDAIHAPWVGGIHGGDHGAYSVAISGGYDDDVDLGYAFTYTGSGGRDLTGTKDAPKNLRTGPQSHDQDFENKNNKALKRSSETGTPVRVIRGFKGKSQYAPSEGYRYDGLYRVEKAWLEKGLNPKGYLVCKFAFKRLPGQPPLPVKSQEDGMDGDEHDDADEPTEATAAD